MFRSKNLCLLNQLSPKFYDDSNEILRKIWKNFQNCRGKSWNKNVADLFFTKFFLTPPRVEGKKSLARVAQNLKIKTQNNRGGNRCVYFSKSQNRGESKR